MKSTLTPGLLAKNKAKGLAVGKLIALSDQSATVEYFESPARQRRLEALLVALKRVRLYFSGVVTSAMASRGRPDASLST